MSFISCRFISVKDVFVPADDGEKSKVPFKLS